MTDAARDKIATATLAAAIAMLSSIAVALLRDLPWLLYAIGIVAVVLICLWLWLILKPQQPDFDKWDKQERFRLWELASLWENIEPQMPLGRRAARRFRKLAKAVRSKELPVDTRTVLEAVELELKLRTEDKASSQWIITRSNAELHAELLGECPPFLFPEERVPHSPGHLEKLWIRVTRSSW